MTIRVAEKCGEKDYRKEEEMKIAKKALAALTVITIIALVGCATKPKVKIVEMENKGTSMGIKPPDWIKNYVANGISAVQAQP
jgi:hypothetical protein